MEANKNYKTLFLLIFISCFSFYNNKNIQPIVNNFNFIDLENTQEAVFDKFVNGNLNSTTTFMAYNYHINNITEVEQIYFDYQSDFGCLSINFSQSSTEKEFCSNDKNNFFIIKIEELLNKSEIIETNVNMIVKVGYNTYLTNESNFDFEYSLKVSLRKPVNILEINSEQHILCQTEKIENNKYRCLFMIVNTNEINDNDNKALIIFPAVNENLDDLNLNIYADNINKTYYTPFDNEFLGNHIPNETSEYINILEGNKINFLRISNIDNNKYIYVSIESEKDSLLEIIPQYISENQEQYTFNESEKTQVFLLNKNSSKITLKFDNSPDLYLSLATIYGKSTVHLGYNTETNYITDIRESHLYLSLDYNKCKSDNCYLLFDNMDVNHIFYISYVKKNKNNLKELIYSKSSRFLFKNIINENQIFLYENLPENIEKEKNININLQIYVNIETKFLNNTFKIEALFLTKDDISKIKVNESYINKFEKTEGELNPLISFININLKPDLYNKSLLIIITPNFSYSKDIIIGTTISQIDSLIYPAERIYHFGDLSSINKVTYRLEGKKQYHLMRLQFGQNIGKIKWSVNRNYNEKNYKNNDTDISFVVEYWKNGRELLTMYIENGEDIYLTIYKEERNKNYNYNYVFKYVNAWKNGDFKNYIIKNDNLDYNIEERNINITEFKAPKNALVRYYMRIYHKNDYKIYESLNSITMIESDNCTFLSNSEKIDTGLKYDLSFIKRYEDYEVNCYVIIFEANSNIELLSYQSLYLEGIKVEKPVLGLIYAALAITGAVLIGCIIRFIHYCHDNCDCCDSYNYDYKYKSKKKKKTLLY